MKIGQAYVESLFEQYSGLYAWAEVQGTRYYLQAMGTASLLDSTLFRSGSTEQREQFCRAHGTTEPVHARTVVDAIPFRPGKVLCLGLNYTDHAQEVGAELPEYPTVFAKYPNALIGPGDPIALPAESTKIDYEAELCAVVGQRIRRADPEAARLAVAGYTLMNDVSVRDWQGRTSEWFQGKNWDRSTPLGPYVVSADQVDPVAGLGIECWVDGELMQSGNTADMIFSPAQAVSYISQFMTLEPGDVVALGTPAGVGMSRRPRRWLAPGEQVRVRAEGLGELSSICRPEAETTEHYRAQEAWAPAMTVQERAED